MSSAWARSATGSSFRAQTLALLRACELRRERGRIAFRWFGDDVGELDARGDEPGADRTALTVQVASTIYSYAYVSGGPVPVPLADRDAGVRPPSPRFAGFVESIAAQVAPAWAWEPGWRVVDVDRTTLILETDGLRVRARAGTCRAADGSEAIAPGSPVAVRRSTTFRRRSPGYLAFTGANLVSGMGGGRPLARIYWHLRPSGAAAFARAVTTSFARQGLPFWAKVLSSPDEYRRCDAGVLYLARSDLGRARSCLREIHAAAAPMLRARVPLWTRPLAPGVAYAEDPRGDESFGMARSRLMAEVIAADVGASDEERLDDFAARLADAGGSLDRPYLWSEPESEPAAAELVEEVASGFAPCA